MLLFFVIAITLTPSYLYSTRHLPDDVVGVKNEERLSAPKTISDFYNPQPGDEDNHHVVISWLLNESHNPVFEETFKASLYESSSLLGNVTKEAEIPPVIED